MFAHGSQYIEKIAPCLPSHAVPHVRAVFFPRCYEMRAVPSLKTNTRPFRVPCTCLVLGWYFLWWSFSETILTLCKETLYLHAKLLFLVRCLFRLCSPGMCVKVMQATFLRRRLAVYFTVSFRVLVILFASVVILGRGGDKVICFKN